MGPMRISRALNLLVIARSRAHAILHYTNGLIICGSCPSDLRLRLQSAPAPLHPVLVECWEMNEAEQTFLDGYTAILMARQVCDTE
jgi:hypothetical protein